HGQNFLVDLNLIELLADAAQLTRDDVVLEVGTGTGSLTGLLAAKAAHVVTVEIDEHLHQLAQEELEEQENITFLHQDALKNKNHFHPLVLDSIKKQMDAYPGAIFKLAANLPYNVATPIISNLLRCSILPESMTVTIQKELADRLVAEPHSKDYGALSVWAQSLCDVKVVRVLPPTVFWPRPKVDSAIVHLVHRPDKRSQIPDIDFFHTFTRRIFFHRRKFLRSVAISAFKNLLNKEEVDQVLQRHHLGPQARTEQLDVGFLQELCESFRQKLLENGAAEFDV
ncbi:MAG: 16S rRNA (adenine(1518)-N(6)/adenine(1519)-N(6))-dimethyltransferase RsmA, partial [Planctomycetota bacterium]